MNAEPHLDAARPARSAPRQRSRRDVEGLSREALALAARDLAVGMRRDARACTRFERRLHVLDLLHRDPQLLAEVVLELTDEATSEGVRPA